MVIAFALGFVAGGVVCLGGWSAFKAKAKADLSKLVADAKAEAAKVGAVSVVQKIEAVIAKL